MEISDPVLLARISGGDQAAFAAFYDRHSSRAYGLILKLVRNPRTAEDVLQDTFWHVWSRAAQFDPQRGSPLAWLILIARSRCLDHLRRNVRQPGVSLAAEFDAPLAITDAAEELGNREAAARAREAIAALPEDQRIAIQLAFFGGLTHQEISERLRTALGTVKTRIRMGIQKLREILGDAGDSLLAADRAAGSAQRRASGAA